MNLAELEKKLLNAARKQPPSEHVPHAFEHRIMARLRAMTSTDDGTVWARALWYGAGVCTAIALVIGVWTDSPSTEQEPDGSFSSDLEQSILPSTGDGDTTW